MAANSISKANVSKGLLESSQPQLFVSENDRCFLGFNITGVLWCFNLREIALKTGFMKQLFHLKVLTCTTHTSDFFFCINELLICSD